jgi:peptidoglycan glycosyltransferase
MNAQSGEILAMSSYPYFDAADLEAQWPALVEDPRAPLLNRAAQGLYPPGPILSPFLAASQVEHLLDFPNPADLIASASQPQTCAFRLIGEPSWNELITNGCQESYQDLVDLMDFTSLVSLFDRLGFYNQPNLYLEVPEASSPPVNPDAQRAVETLRISPLQAALASAALTHQGIRPGPRIVNAYQDSDGNWVTLPKNESSVQSFEAELVDAADNLLKIPGASLWYVTAITETDDGQEITWFLSGTTANWQGQPLVVVVLLEKSAPAAAQAIGNTLLLETLNIPLGQ